MAGITLKETAAASVPTPATDKSTIFVDSADGLPKYKDDTGTTHTLKGDDGTPGTGDVDGPASAVDSRIAAFDGTTGKLLKDGGKTIADIVNPSINGTVLSNTITPTGTNDLLRATGLSAGLTIANYSSTPADGWGLVLEIKDNGSSRSLTWGSKYASRIATLPTATTAGKLHLVGLSYNAADDKFYCDFALVES